MFSLPALLIWTAFILSKVINKIKFQIVSYKATTHSWVDFIEHVCMHPSQSTIIQQHAKCQGEEENSWDQTERSIKIKILNFDRDCTTKIGVANCRRERRMRDQCIRQKKVFTRIVCDSSLCLEVILVVIMISFLLFSLLMSCWKQVNWFDCQLMD